MVIAWGHAAGCTCCNADEPELEAINLIGRAVLKENGGEELELHPLFTLADGLSASFSWGRRALLVLDEKHLRNQVDAEVPAASAPLDNESEVLLSKVHDCLARCTLAKLSRLVARCCWEDIATC